MTAHHLLAHAGRVLEYDAIRQRVVGAATSVLGQERAAEMEPSESEDEVLRLQAETKSAVRLCDAGSGVPLGGIHDIRRALQAASVGGLLETTALLEVADTAAAGRKLKSYLLQRRETAPALAELAARIGEFPLLEQTIHEAIDDHAQVRDDASDALARLRRELKVVRSRMMERLQSILRSPGYRDMIQDPVVTTRDGRLCIPVKSECRTQFGGLVHDQSSSGATVFMEPTSVVELGNEVRQVEIRERHEVERILRELTGRVGRVVPDLAETVHALAELDFILARARLALEMDATEPIINREGFIGLRRARHPLLSGDVVPIDLDLGRQSTVLIITGPNTGGKTVSLKTVGLLALMSQSGLQIPADEGSTLPVFEGIYADIGDEQSIQQSLSTFSAHIRNIGRILSEVGRTRARSLVLLDEVGAGTDPTEGAALAKAILSFLHRSGARAIGTTHYGELKEFAYATPGVENASVEFDEETLRPTYRLLVGIPGASNAFSIAARLGLPEEVVKLARSMVGTEQAVLSDVIRKLTEDRRSTEVDSRRAAQAARDVEAQRHQYDLALKQLKADRTDTLRRAREEADETLRNARRETERVREQLRAMEKEARRLAEEPGSVAGIRKVREQLQALSGESERQPESGEPVAAAAAPVPEPELTATAPLELDVRPPEVGDLVWVAGFNQRGTMLTAPEAGKAQVQIGSMRMALPVASLQRILSQRPSGGTTTTMARTRSGSDVRLLARANISPEIQLRGLRAEDALTRLDEYVDQACLAGLESFRIVHGKGTGALKRVVWEYLHAHPGVARYQHPTEEEGGTGATIVELKE